MNLVSRTNVTTGQLKKLVDEKPDLVVLLENQVLSGLLMTLRNKNSVSSNFRQATSTIGTLLVYEMGQVIPYSPLHVETPMNETAHADVVNPPYIVEVLRAGQELVEGGWLAIPDSYGVSVAASRSHGLLDYLTANVTYCSLKKENVVPERPVFLLDIMLASGVSAIGCINKLKELGVGRIYMGSVISTEFGIQKIQEAHPDVTHFTCAIDPRLNEIGYILPGLGDAGDRLFGTEK